MNKNKLLEKKKFNPFGNYRECEEYFLAQKENRTPKVRLFNKDDVYSEEPESQKDRTLREQCKRIIRKRNEIYTDAKQKFSNQEKKHPGSFFSLHAEFFSLLASQSKGELNEEFHLFPEDELSGFFDSRLKFLCTIPLRQRTLFNMEVEMELAFKKEIKIMNIYGKGELKRELLEIIVSKYSNLELFEIKFEDLEEISKSEDKGELLCKKVNAFKPNKSNASKVILLDSRDVTNITIDFDSLLLKIPYSDLKIVFLLSDERFHTSLDGDVVRFRIEKLTEADLLTSVRQLSPFEGMFLDEEMLFVCSYLCRDSLTESDILKCSFKVLYPVVYCFLTLLKLKGKRAQIKVSHLVLIQKMLSEIGFGIAFTFTKELKDWIGAYFNDALLKTELEHKLMDINNRNVRESLLSLIDLLKG